MAAQHYYEFEVKMACGGCSGAVERVLKKLPGVTKYNTDLASQKVHVSTEETVDLATVEATIKKTGKEVVSAKEINEAPMELSNSGVVGA